MSEGILKLLRNLYIPELGYCDSWGIGHENNPMESKIAYDILQVLRYNMAWHREPKGGYTVDFTKPMQFGCEDMCTVQIEGSGEE